MVVDKIGFHVLEKEHKINIGKFIRDRRIELGLTQPQLAYMIGSRNEQNPSSRISDIEGGRYGRLPNTLTLIRLAIALRIELVDLLILSGIIEGCTNKNQLNSASNFIEAWDGSLDVKEAVRLIKGFLDVSLTHRSGITNDVKDLLYKAKRNVDYLHDFCFNRKPLTEKIGPILRSKKSYLRPHVPGPRTNGFTMKVKKIRKPKK